MGIVRRLPVYQQYGAVKPIMRFRSTALLPKILDCILSLDNRHYCYRDEKAKVTRMALVHRAACRPIAPAHRRHVLCSGEPGRCAAALFCGSEFPSEAQPLYWMQTRQPALLTSPPAQRWVTALCTREPMTDIWPMVRTVAVRRLNGAITPLPLVAGRAAHLLQVLLGRSL